MGMKSKFKSFFFLEENEEPNVPQEQKEERVEQTPVPPTTTNKQNVVSLQSLQKSSKVILFEPRVYAESQEITDQLINRRSVVVNLQRIQPDQAIRIVDFLSGTVYSIGGDIQRIGPSIFLCTPDNVEVDGTISEIMEDKQFKDMRWK